MRTSKKTNKEKQEQNPYSLPRGSPGFKQLPTNEEELRSLATRPGARTRLVTKASQALYGAEESADSGDETRSPFSEESSTSFPSPRSSPARQYLAEAVMMADADQASELAQMRKQMREKDRQIEELSLQLQSVLRQAQSNTTVRPQ